MTKGRAASPRKAKAKPATSIDEYLARVPGEQRALLEKLRGTIRRAAPRATECISYQMPAFRHAGRGLVCFAAFREHCSLFPMSARLLGELGDEVAGFMTSKGTLQFTLDRPLPARLVTKIVRARIAENERRAMK